MSRVTTITLSIRENLSTLMRPRLFDSFILFTLKLHMPGNNEGRLPLPRMSLRVKPQRMRDAFMAQMDDPVEDEISLPDGRMLTVQIDALRKRLMRMIERAEAACTFEDLGGK